MKLIPSIIERFIERKGLREKKHMIRLLEGNYRKMEKIIRILSISDKWMTKKELAKRIGSSESTFVRYIEEIKIRWGTDITIQSSQKLGYRLEHLNVPAYLNVLMEMSQSSTNSRLLMKSLSIRAKRSSIIVKKSRLVILLLRVS